jgi:hypothetical protein
MYHSLVSALHRSCPSLARSVFCSVVSVARLVIRVYRSHALTIHRIVPSIGRSYMWLVWSFVRIVHSLIQSIDPAHLGHVRGSSGHSCVCIARSLIQSIDSSHQIRGSWSFVCMYYSLVNSIDPACHSVVSEARLVIRVYVSLARKLHRSRVPFSRVRGSSGHSCVCIARFCTPSLIYVARPVIRVNRSFASSIHRSRPFRSCPWLVWSFVRIVHSLLQSIDSSHHIRGSSGHSCVSFTR